MSSSCEFGPSHERKKRAFWQTIERIETAEGWLDNKLETIVREATYQKSDLSMRQKTLRLFFRYQFIPASEDPRPHFLVIVDGLVLDQKRRNVPFAKYLQFLRMQVVERKPGWEPQTVEWHEGTNPEGSSASTIVARIYGEKAVNLKISIGILDDVQSIRYELPEGLKKGLTSMGLSIAPMSLDDLCLAVMGYAGTARLFTDKDRRYIRCDDLLKDLFVVDMLPVWTLRQRMGQLLSAGGVPSVTQVELFLSPTPTEEVMSLNAACNAPVLSMLANNPSSAAIGSRNASNLFNRLQGKTVDVTINEREDIEQMAFLQDLHGINVDLYDASKRTKVCGLMAQQAAKEAALDIRSADYLTTLLDVVNAPTALRKQRAVQELDSCTEGIMIKRSDLENAALLPPFYADLITHRQAPCVAVAGDNVRALPSALHSLGAYRSADCASLLDGRNASLQKLFNEQAEQVGKLFDFASQRLLQQSSSKAEDAMDVSESKESEEVKIKMEGGVAETKEDA